MKRIPLYSSSKPARLAAPPAGTGDSPQPASVPVTRRSWREFCARHERALSFAASTLAALLLIAGYAAMRTELRPLKQEDIDGAVLHTLENNVLPSADAKAYEAVRGSVVRVRGFSPDTIQIMGKGKDKDKVKSKVKVSGKGKDTDKEKEEGKEAEVVQGIGTGVVIIDKGIILTNLHVVQGFTRITVTFADGLESDAYIIGTSPENDLAVLRAQTIPDDLVAATLKSTHDLAPGDRVIAVGFPFGIGPSASAGVVAGLKREYRSPEGKRVLTNLIQFDAAVNPGNSGGPLVTADGGVVGIVTGILNPTGQRVFIGIGFAVPIENAAAAVGVPPF